MVQISECTTIAAMERNFPLLQLLYNTLTEEKYYSMLHDMQPMGYRQVGVLIEGKYVAIAGFHCATHLSSGRYLYVDDLVVEPNHRGKQYSKALLLYLEEEAKRFHCQHIFLDAFVENNPAHKIYHAQGFAIAAFHFIKTINK